MQWDLAGSSLGDSPNGSGSSLGTRQEIARRRPEDSPQECRKLSDWREVWSSPKEGGLGSGRRPVGAEPL
ncbi:hypothetical protein BHE74_00035931 [Ensete ventricosum]|nr:hypothetical protein BHE74_00035931 [Ensete ventricosum]